MIGEARRGEEGGASAAAACIGERKAMKGVRAVAPGW